MDGKPGWMTIRYAFCWVRTNKTYLPTLEDQCQLRWPTSYDASTDIFTPHVGSKR